MSTCRELGCGEQHGLIEGWCDVHALDLESIRAGLDRLFGDAGGCHDLEDAENVVRLVLAARRF
jgi:hypothetical protein